jgi:hypothetical protein
MELIEKQMESLVMSPLKGMVKFLESCLSDLETPCNDDGEQWYRLAPGYAGVNGVCSVVPYCDETSLDLVRSVGRRLVRNPFGNNAYQNRISYVVGWGHTYTISARAGEDVSEEQLSEHQNWIHEWLKANKWCHRQQTNMLRRDRDGEALLRKFRTADGLAVRYIEPEMLRSPVGRQDIRYGIETDPDDYETIKAYWVNGKPIPASEVQHRTRGVDRKDLRGIPILFDVRQNLERALRTLRNASTVTEIQTAIAMIRKHVGATKTAVQALVNTSTTQRTDAQGRTENVSKFAPGSIIDANHEVEFPVIGIDPSKYVPSIQAELRATASHLVMPEYMLTSDASNANMASTMVAESPAVKNFERLQQDEIEFDVEILEEARKIAVEQGRISGDILERTEIKAEAPRIAVRDDDKLAESDRKDVAAGIMSTQTARARRGLDDDTEQANIEAHQERTGAPLSGDRPALDGQQQDDDEDEIELKEPAK